ncbi:MAG: threonine/serine exporter family protein [Clostridiales bacterium]|nr:threonine/serine exporter family protein [Candidatus Crickella equi]
MNYHRIVKGILDIGEAMLKSGAENFRLDDSIYRMCHAYGFKHSDVFAIPSNIQITVETQDGEFITQVRHIESTSVNLDRLDYLNDLCRYVCANTPDADELAAKFHEVMSRKPQPTWMYYVAMLVGGTAFAVFFGGHWLDAIIAAVASLAIAGAGSILSKREHNLLVYNTLLAFLAEIIILCCYKFGLDVNHKSIMIGIVMLLISAMSTTNGIRELLQRDFISGSINIMNSILGAAGIAVGTALAMLALYDIQEADTSLIANSAIVQLLSCTIGCIAFAVLFKVKGRQVVYSGIGAFCTYAIYLVAIKIVPSNFFATLMGAIFVALYAFIMSRVNKAPSTIFLTASVFPLIPGAALYYVMYGFVIQDYAMVQSQTFALVSTCLAISFGFLIVDVVTRTIMEDLEIAYHIGKDFFK